MIKVAINGFGRIGRLVYRIMDQDPEMEVVAINDLTDAEQLAYLLKYDTNHRTYKLGDISFDGNDLVDGGRHVKVYSETDPSALPWGDLGVDIVMECTQTIPDRLNLVLAVCGVVSVLLSPAAWLPHVIGALCVSLPMFLLCLVIDGAFGGGDIKLMAAAGLFLGWQNTLLAMFFGIVFGGMYGIYLLAAKKAGKKDHFAFGPFLCAGIVIAMLFGGPVLEWYCAFL